MSYVDLMEQQHLKARFVRMTLVNDTNNPSGDLTWRVAGDGGVNQVTGGASDAEARELADAWLTGNGYFQITYWTAVEGAYRSLWVH